MTEMCISDYLIIEISDATSVGKTDAVKIKELLNMDQFDKFYTNGAVFDNKEIDSYNFVFLDQGLTSLDDIINSIISKNKCKKILFAIHKSGNHIRTVNDVIGNTYKKKDFSHESNYPVWSDGLNPLINSIKNQEEYNKYFKIVCDLIYSPLNEAMELRAQLLTSLVALDWIAQMSALGSNTEINDPTLKQKAIEVFKITIAGSALLNEWKDMFSGEKFQKLKKDVLEKEGLVVHEDLIEFASEVESSIEKLQQSSN